MSVHTRILICTCNPRTCMHVNSPYLALQNLTPGLLTNIPSKESGEPALGGEDGSVLSFLVNIIEMRLGTG